MMKKMNEVFFWDNYPQISNENIKEIKKMYMDIIKRRL